MSTDRALTSAATAGPLNPYNRRHLRLRLDSAAALVNEGFWVMSIVQGETYQFPVAARGTDGFSGPLAVSVQKSDGPSLAAGTIARLTDQWQWYSLDLTASGTDPKARLALNAEGKGTAWLDMVSLLPKQTWKDHGLRPDLCEMLAALKPAFVRFPGGCWVEGNDLAHSYRWKETVVKSFDLAGPAFQQSLPANSVTVLRVPVSE